MRKRSNLLKILHALNDRMVLSKRLSWRLEHYELGYQYECWADRQYSHGNWLVINSLSLSREGEFIVQMDLLVLTGDKILLYELKAYTQPVTDCRDGTIQYHEDGEKYESPFVQLENAHIILEKLLKSMKIDLDIESYVMITHPDGNIYNLPEKTKNLLIRSQIAGHLLEEMKNAAQPTAETKILYERLKSLDHDTSEFNSIIPKYNYQGLRKIVKCPKCFSVISEIPKHKKYVHCKECNKNILVRDIARLAFDDYVLLFNGKPTMRQLHEWCEGLFTKHRLYQMLSD